MDVNDFLTLSFCYVVLLLLCKLCCISSKCYNQIKLLIHQEQESYDQEQESYDQEQESYDQEQESYDQEQESYDREQESDEQESEPQAVEKSAIIKNVITLKDVKIFVSKIRTTKLKLILTRMRKRLMIPAWYTKYDFEKLLETSITDADWKKLLLDFPDVNQFMIDWYNNRNSKSSIDSGSDELVSKKLVKHSRIRKIIFSGSSKPAPKKLVKHNQFRKIILSE